MEPEKLSDRVASSVRNPDTELYVSAASAWEVTIKASLGKIKLPCSVPELFRATQEELLAHWLPIELSHLERLAALPLHHRDPFDRLLISQATAEGIAIVSTDQAMKLYDVELIW